MGIHVGICLYMYAHVHVHVHVPHISIYNVSAKRCLVTRHHSLAS